MAKSENRVKMSKSRNRGKMTRTTTTFDMTKCEFFLDIWVVLKRTVWGGLKRPMFCYLEMCTTEVGPADPTLTVLEMSSDGHSLSIPYNPTFEFNPLKDNVWLHLPPKCLPKLIEFFLHFHKICGDLC